MSEQHHRVRRQVFEVRVKDASDAWPLQQSLSRLQTLHVEALIDRCCTEAGAPNRLHRIESLEIDLGQLDLVDFERDLLAKLGPSLRHALAEQIGASDERAARAGEDPEAASQLELVALFARTGTLPWWADTSRPRALNDAVGFLLKRAAPSLVRLVRSLARQRALLRRVVINCNDDHLVALFGALLTASHHALGESLPELRALSQASAPLAGVTPSRLRTAIWAGALRVAANDAQGVTGRLAFWREVLAQIALEAGVTYKTLVFGLEEGARPERSGRPGLPAEIVGYLARELRGSAHEPACAPGGAERRGPPFESARPELAEISMPDPGASAGARSASGPRGPEPQARPAMSPAEQARQAAWRAQESAAIPAGHEQAAAELELLLSRLARQDATLRFLFEELTVAAREAPPAKQEALLEALGAVGREASTRGLFGPETVASLLRTLRWVIEQRYLSVDALGRFLETTRERATASSSVVEPPIEGAVLRELQRLARETIRAGTGLRAGDVRASGGGAAGLLVARPSSDALGEAPTASAPPSDVTEAQAASALSGDKANEATARPLSGDAIVGPAAPAAPAAPSSSGDAAEARRARPLSEGSTEVSTAQPRTTPPKGEIAGPGGEPPRRATAGWQAGPAHSASAVDRAKAGGTALLGLDASPTPLVGELAARGEASRAVPPARWPSPAFENLPPGLEYADAEEVYVENAGLVILWPFLERFFERLGLMAKERCFKDEAARSRAAGLLQHLATGELEPVEYQLALAKVICGIEVAEVVEFGRLVTEPEAEECADLLRAAVANAPILGEMSIAGFRGSFLNRRGVLSARDGAFLLRVERVEYDVVLDRFPWGVSWVRLPWMEAPLAVEW